MYEVIIKETAQKQLRKMALAQIVKIEKVILKLQANPRPVGCKKLVGSQHIYRIRIGK